VVFAAGENKGIKVFTDDGTKLWTFGTDGSLTVPGDIRSEGAINIDINLSDSTLRRWRFGEDGALTLPSVGKINNGAYDWTFGTNGSLALPSAGKITNGVDTAQVGSTQTIADDGSGGLVGWSSQALSIAYDPNVISTYPVGSTITWQDGTTATITGYDDYGPTYIDIFWDTPKTGTLFPIILKTANYAAAYTAPEWTFGTDGALTFPDATVQTTALVQGEHIFTLDTGAIDYAPTVVDFNLLFVTPAIGYSGTDPTSVTLPAGVPGQRLVIFNGYNLATLTVNPGPVGRDISSGVVAEFIYSGFDGVWIPLYGTNSPT
jgi:hypothetical protein